MESLLRVDTSSTFPGSPTNSFLDRADVASICPLLTPSPPTNALVNPLPVTEETNNFINAQELSKKLHHVNTQDDHSDERCDSASSSSSSALAEPSCTQLLTNHNHYLHVTKDEEAAAQETNGKTQTLQMTFRNPPENYFFMKWNWPLIRKVSTWLIMSGLVAMVGIVVAMIWTLPKTCNPPVLWFQGKLMYEIFPASFSDSNGDGIGDLRGVASRIDYFEELGVKAVRLDSIFPAHHYPEDFKNVTSLTEIAPQLGTIADLRNLIVQLHERDIYLTIDLPIWPHVKTFVGTEVEYTEYNKSDIESSYEFLQVRSRDDNPVTNAIDFWTKQGVDGFYLRGLENFLEDEETFLNTLKRWRKIVGPDRMFLVNYSFVEAIPKELLKTILSYVDLVDVQLDLEEGVEKISEQIEAVLNSTLFGMATAPWVHWSLGNEDTVRLANRLPFSNATLGATLLQLMLPGTPSIFYGDEVGMKQVSDPHEDRRATQHLHQLAAMAWSQPNRPFTRQDILPWMHSQPTPFEASQVEIISKMAALRSTSASIYVNSVTKEDINKANAEIKYKENDLLVVQRWYPRRKSYVVVANLGCVHISADLSTLLYSGQVVVGPSGRSKSESVSFKEISLWPGESVVIVLD